MRKKSRWNKCNCLPGINGFPQRPVTDKPQWMSSGNLSTGFIRWGEKKYFQMFPIREHFITFVEETTIVRVIAKKTLRDFWEDNNDCEQQLKAWYGEASGASWKTPNDIKRDYPSASVLEDNRVVFNIKGNNYRLIVKINYRFGMVWIRFIGTHAEYDQVDATTI